MNYKELKKLADTCRKAGIRHFKNADMEFTLTDDAPVVKSRNKSDSLYVKDDKPFTSDSLTDEQLLLWSVVDPSTEGKDEEGAA